MMEHIETIELTSSQASITFSSIPQDYDDLIVLLSPRSDRANTADTLAMTLNSSTTNRSTVNLRGTGSAVNSFTQTILHLGEHSAATSTSNTFGSISAYISNYTASQAKSISVDSVSEANSTEAFQYLMAELWNETSAVTSIQISFISGNLETGCVASLYGVTAGGSGTVTTT